MGKKMVGVGQLSSKTVAAVLDFMSKRSKDEVETLMLSLVVAEMLRVYTKKHWAYDEKFDELYVNLQSDAVRWVTMFYKGYEEFGGEEKGH